MICDFCGVYLTEPWWEYPCEAFVIDVLICGPEGEFSNLKANSPQGGWSACICCHEILLQRGTKSETDIINELAERGAQDLVLRGFREDTSRVVHQAMLREVIPRLIAQPVQIG